MSDGKFSIFAVNVARGVYADDPAFAQTDLDAIVKAAREQAFRAVQDTLKEREVYDAGEIMKRARLRLGVRLLTRG
jgi:hypothetical protein